MIRVLLADDHKIVRDGLKRILSGNIEVAAEAASGSRSGATRPGRSTGPRCSGC